MHIYWILWISRHPIFRRADLINVCLEIEIATLMYVSGIHSRISLLTYLSGSRQVNLAGILQDERRRGCRAERLRVGKELPVTRAGSWGGASPLLRKIMNFRLKWRVAVNSDFSERCYNKTWGFPVPVLGHCWLGHLTRKNRPRNDLCV